MDVFKVSGNGPLHGQIEVGGAKNAALPILAATLLAEETVVLRNVCLLYTSPSPRDVP